MNKDTWRRLFSSASESKLYSSIVDAGIPDSDWVDYSPEKITDFIKAVIASFEILDNGSPFSTAETGVFAGGTSSVFLHVLSRAFQRRSIHIGIDPYFSSEQSFGEYIHDYGQDAYLVCLKELSLQAYTLGVPYVPYLMSSRTFINKDLLPASYEFRLFHLDGDHSRDAVLGELDYFSSRLTNPGVFILDDIGETFPGVLEAAAIFQKAHTRFIELACFEYDTRSGRIGFGVYYCSPTLQ